MKKRDKKKIINYIFRMIIFLVISIIVGLTFYTINAKRVTGKALAMPFNKTIAVVSTGSMEPTITLDDLIIIEKTEDYQIGDIVVFQDGSLVVVHRIVAIDGDKIITAGDGNDGAIDDPIWISEIYGEVIHIIPVLGFILKMIKSPLGLIITITIAIIFLVLSYQKEREEKQKSIDLIKEEIEKVRKELRNN